VAGKNGLFQAGYDVHHGKRAPFRDVGRDLMKMNGSQERFPAKWTPVRVKKTRQIKNLEPRSDSIGTEKALEATASACLGGGMPNFAHAIASTYNPANHPFREVM
jgi:hypothetical protein